MSLNQKVSKPFERQPHKIVKHTQTICRLFDHFVGLALKGLTFTPEAFNFNIKYAYLFSEDDIVP